MGIEKIVGRITEQAQEAYNAETDGARREAEKIIAEARMRAEVILKDAEEKGKCEKDKIIKYRSSAAGIDAGKIVLAKKQEILSECFEKATEAIVRIEEERYVKLLTALGEAADMYGGRLLFNADEKERIGQRVCDGLNRAAALRRKERYGDDVQYAERFTLDEATGTMKGGYIITYRKTFADCTVEALVKEHRSELAGEAAKILFG